MFKQFAPGGHVRETLARAGTLEPAGRADLSFATSGTVESVRVRPGQRVRAGAVLGTLDDTSLRSAVQQARSTLAAARAQLESDEDAQSEAVADAQSQQAAPQVPNQPQQPTQPQPSQPPTEQPTEQPTEDPVDPGALADLAEEQQAVTDAQSAVSAALAAAADALATQQAACTEATQDCTDALAAVQAAQQQVSTDQQALQDALSALADTLAEAIPTSASTGGSGVRLVAAETGTVSAATIARDQAAIDQARADLLTAQQELRMATITAPFGGEVVSVDAGAGDSVASGSAVFVLVSPGTTTVQVDATSTQVRQLEVGQAARVTPTGSDRPLAGTVTQISSVPDDSSSYPVTITLEGRRLDLATGLTATAAVVTGRAEDVVTVPVSAGSDGSVTVLDDGEATRTRVTTGVTGATTVAVTGGLDAGDVVVLADLDEALPSGDQQGQRPPVGVTSGFGGPPQGVTFGR